MAFKNNLLNLLIQFDYHKEKPSKQSIAKIVIGILSFLLFLLLLCFGVATGFPDFTSRIAAIAIFSGTLLTLPGIWLTLSGMSDQSFARWNKITKIISPKISQYLSGIMSTLAVAASILFSVAWIILDPTSEDRTLMLTQLSALIVAMTSMCLVASQGPIQIGIIANEARFKSRATSVFFELCAIAAPLIAALVVLGTETTGALWIPATVTGIALMIGYWRFRVVQLGVAFQGIVKALDNIREESLNVISASNRKNRIKSHNDLLRNYRNLHFTLVSHPSYSQRPTSSYSLISLCMAVEMRRSNSTHREAAFTGPNRVRAVQSLLQLSDTDFAMQSKQVFEGMIMMLDQSMVPGFKKIKSGDDLSSVLGTHILQ